ncbi:hypothetical protein MRB53_017365 [Persea americana]|uniref:Uncharacterized protein n=1 Tax=Persea americana TaxID=3435 RepID=A0ACC2M5Q7_PERAE|nr:hypothetical protein MRB53_017365 [Persea americana]
MDGSALGCSAGIDGMGVWYLRWDGGDYDELVCKRWMEMGGPPVQLVIDGEKMEREDRIWLGPGAIGRWECVMDMDRAGRLGFDGLVSDGEEDFRREPLSRRRAPTAIGDSSDGRRFWAVARRAARSATVVVRPDLLSSFSSQTEVTSEGGPTVVLDAGGGADGASESSSFSQCVNFGKGFFLS